MSREQLSVSELLLSLDSSELQEAELVRAAVNQQLSTDRGGAVLSSLVDHYLDSWSPQAVLLLSSIRESHHKVLLEKLHESVTRPGSRLGALTLLGHLIRKQPPWVHHVSRSALLGALLRCLKTDTDVVVLISGVLVLITLLPMIPQAGKQHIYDFFDVFGRLASWSFRNPGHAPLAHQVHLHAGVYSLFHRLYGMFPCNFISYLRLHYSMKENLDTFQEVIKPMLEHVRVHPELVTGTQEYELDPTRWRCYEVHDIVIECSRLSLDPLESSCEDEVYSSLREPLPSPTSPRPPPLASPLPHLDLTSETSGSPACPRPSAPLTPPTVTSSLIQADVITWSPSSHCGLSTPPPEPAAGGSAPSLGRTMSLSAVKCPSPATVPVAPQPEQSQDGGQAPEQGGVLTEQEVASLQPITAREGGASHVIHNLRADFGAQQQPDSSPRPGLLSSTPSRSEASSGSSLRPPPSFCFSPCDSSTEQEGGSALFGPALFGSAHADLSPAPPYEPLFDLALPRAATLFIGRKTQELLDRAGGAQESAGGAQESAGGAQESAGGAQESAGVGEGEDREEHSPSVSPLKVLDQLIIHGYDAHEGLGRRLSGATRSVDRGHSGGPAQGEELQSLRSQLLLVHGQLQYERFKRQQHAIRNRRLLRRVINATALEEQSVAMKGQLSVLEEEIRCLKMSLDEEQQRYTLLQQDTHTHTEQLHTTIRQLLQQQQDEQRDRQRLQSDLLECQSRVRDLEAELQRANNKAYNAEHQLAQLSVKLSSSEQLQQQIFLLNQQLVLLRDTNRALTEQLDATDRQHGTEVSMLQCTVGKENQRLRDSDVQQRQKLEAANQRAAELETQLAKRDQQILDQKKLLEDTKAQSRSELLASDSCCVALRRLAQTLQTEMLHLYSLVHLEPHGHAHGADHAHSPGHAHSRPQDVCGRPDLPRPSSSSSVGIINGVDAFSTSPLHPPSCSSSPLSLSPIDSPLAVGSYLEQRARHLFRPTNRSQGEEEPREGEEPQQQEEQEEQRESPPLGQEAEEASLPPGSGQLEPPALSLPGAAAPPGAGPGSAAPPGAGPGAAAPPGDLSLAVRHRRDELSIMDYDETMPEY